ncbi:MAG: DNA polymerase [Planctomycetota bacterium]
MNVTISQLTLPFSIWDGKRLTGPVIALDTETTMIDPDHPDQVPELVLAAASDGQEHVIIPREDLPRFIQVHGDEKTFVAHNVAFDFWVVLEELKRREAREAIDSWWKAIEEGRLHDTMILDQLIRLAEEGEKPYARSLEDLLDEYGQSGMVDKNSPYRTRFGAIMGKKLDDVDTRFLEYAISDVIVLVPLYRLLWKKAVRLGEEAFKEREGKVSHQEKAIYGPLSHHIQVRGAIALASVERKGIGVDGEKLERLKQVLTDRIEDLASEAEKAAPVSGFLLRSDDGALEKTDKGSPRQSHEALRKNLQAIWQKIGDGSQKPTTAKTEEISCRAEYWENYRDRHPFLDAWLKMKETQKLLGYLESLESPRSHSRYYTMTRTGRTSCREPNIQQVPRDEEVREIFVPSSGCVFYIADYSSVELRTLAQECLDRYGQSRLAQTLHKGQDPHAYTAARILGMDYESFCRIRETDSELYGENRQKAKALNFGIPGGLGVETMRQYAGKTFGVELSEWEAKYFRTQFVEEVYPEIGLYLESRDDALLARALGCSPEELRHSLIGGFGCADEWVLPLAMRILRGKRRKASDDQPYSPETIERVRRALLSCCRDDAARELIRKNLAKKDLTPRLIRRHVVTRTGRRRANVTYTAARNTPFQGLAADGAKLALYDLVRAGYRIVAFIHDEVVIEVPEHKATPEEAERIDRMLVRGMESVCPDIPIKVEGHYAERWTK